MTRFQDSVWYVKLWRYRHIIYIPFKWVWFMTFDSFIVTNDMNGDKDIVTGRWLWKLLVGCAHGDMEYYWTMDEVKERFKRKKL